MLGIPSVVWAALLGAGLTLIGVLLSNRHNRKLLGMQLGHDTEERQKDRINSLRKGVYLNAAEEFANANKYLGRLPQINLENENVDASLSGFFSASAKLQLVCRPDTAGLATELTVRYSEILMRLLEKVMPVHNLNGEIRVDNELYERNQADVERTLQEMQHLNESGELDEARFASLKTSLEFAQERANHFSDKRIKASDQHRAALNEYTAAMLGELRSIGTLQAQLLTAMRAELELPTDMAKIKELQEKNFRRVDASVKALQDSLERS